MRRKMISAILAATMVLSLTACGTSASDPTTAAKGNEAAASGSANELTVWCWDPAFNIYAMEEATKFYQKDHPDFKLNIVETPWADLQTKVTVAATSGNLDSLPDIILMQDNAFQKNVISYPDAFVDLTGSSISFGDFAPAKTAYSVVDGKNYGVPFDNGAAIAAYRMDVLGEAGYTTDDLTDITWSRYLEIGKDVLAKTGKPLLSCLAGESDLIVMMLQSAGGSFFDENGQPMMAGNDKLKAVMEIYAELVKNGVLVEVNSWDQYVGTITNSMVAGTINGCWIMATIQTSEDQTGQWRITNMPKLEGVSDATNYSNQGGSSWAITSNCKNVELATDFFAKTFAGSVELYETILPKSGALATYLPAGDSSVYSEPQSFYGDVPVFEMITEFAGKIPSSNTGVYFYEARDAIGTANTNVVAGADIDSEIKTAEDTVRFTMGQ